MTAFTRQFPFPFVKGEKHQLRTLEHSLIWAWCTAEVVWAKILKITRFSCNLLPLTPTIQYYLTKHGMLKIMGQDLRMSKWGSMQVLVDYNGNIPFSLPVLRSEELAWKSMQNWFFLFHPSTQIWVWKVYQKAASEQPSGVAPYTAHYISLSSSSWSINYENVSS